MHLRDLFRFDTFVALFHSQAPERQDCLARMFAHLGPGCDEFQ